MKHSLSSPPISLRQRLFHAACWLYGVPLPDRQQHTSRNRSLDLLLRLVSAVLLALIICFAISYVVECANDFLDGYHSVGAPGVPRERWPLPWGILVAVLLVTMATIQNSVLQSAVKITAERLELERERARRQELESTLRLLKAQIEPHFLFNALGAVQQLAEDKAPAAALLTADLIAFLRATLSSLRADTTTLADDCAICEAYLRVMQARLTHRLEFGIDCPPSLRKLPLPTALLLTLVENAVKHGIEPSASGGRIDIRAEHLGDRITISVADTGVGFGETVGQGLGLQHIRDRLAIAYEGKANLVMEANTPNGVVARLTFPPL
jgi:signal transduction histidine kinase